MSTTAMWLLLAVVIVVILFGSVLYKRTFTTIFFRGEPPSSCSAGSFARFKATYP